MMIAACMDANGAVAPLQRGTRLDLYERTRDKGWTLRRTVPFDISREASLTNLKTILYRVWETLEGCRVLLLAEVRGIACAILQEEMGVRTWVSQGPLEAQLDGVAEREADLTRKPPPPPPPRSRASACGGGCGGASASACSSSGDPAVMVEPDRVGSPSLGLWRFDLAAVLGADPSFNSFDVLLPVLERGGFRRLEVLCDHLPRWLLPIASQLDLRVTVEEVAPVTAGSTGALRVLVEPDANGEADADQASARPRTAARRRFARPIGCGGGA